MKTKLPSSVKIVEVGPRDGLQNEAQFVPTETKIAFINQLSQTGLSCIEATSFVSPEWIKQLADNTQVLAGITRNPKITYPVLIPNLQGLEQALNSNLQEICIFTAASNTFCEKNINCTITESLQRYEKVIALAKQKKIPVRGYLSCVIACPYEGPLSPQQVSLLVNELLAMGCYEVSLGDTIGVGTPHTVNQLLNEILKQTTAAQLAVHFHDTYGQAIANIYAALQYGIAVIDSSVAGLGGCPYAKGASGNVATEDVVYLLNGLGIQTGIDLKKLVETAWFISNHLNKKPNSKVSIAQKPI